MKDGSAVAPSPEALRVQRLMRGDPQGSGIASKRGFARLREQVEFIHGPSPKHYPSTDPKDHRNIGYLKRGVCFSLRNAPGGTLWEDLGTVPLFEVWDRLPGIAPLLDTDSYMTLNSVLYGRPHQNKMRDSQGFRRPTRRAEWVTHLNALSIDFDCYRINGLTRYKVRALVDECLEDLGVPASMWSFSSGLRAVFKLHAPGSDEPPRAHDGPGSTNDKWRAVLERLCEKLHEFAAAAGVPSLGIDSGATMDLAGTIRLSGSVSSKDRRVVTHSINKAADGTPSYTLDELCDLLDVRLPQVRRKSLAAAPITDRIRTLNRAGGPIRYLRLLRQTEGVFRERTALSVPVGERNFAVWNFAQVLQRARLAARRIIDLGLEDHEKVRELATPDELRQIAFMGAGRRVWRVEHFAAVHCERGRGSDGSAFNAKREAPRKVLSAERRNPGRHLKTKVLAESFRVTAEEADRERCGGQPWPVVGVDARPLRDRRRSARRAVLVELNRAGLGILPTINEMREALREAHGGLPDRSTVRADLDALGLRIEGAGPRQAPGTRRSNKAQPASGSCKRGLGGWKSGSLKGGVSEGRRPTRTQDPAPGPDPRQRMPPKGAPNGRPEDKRGTRSANSERFQSDQIHREKPKNDGLPPPGA